MESVVNFLLKSYDLEPIDLPDVRQEEKRLNETYKYQLETLLSFVKKIGFQSIYILIDRPDETEQTGNNPEKTYRLIQPLIRDLELLGLKGYAFKFFLWDQIEPFFREDARPDRVSQYKLQWTRKRLKEALSKRLAAFSEGRITTFDSIMKDGSGIDDVICLLANGSPRNMIRLCEKIFAIQGERDAKSPQIEYASVDLASVEFSELLFIENYGESVLKEIQRVGRELFTTNVSLNWIQAAIASGFKPDSYSASNIGLPVRI